MPTAVAISLSNAVPTAIVFSPQKIGTPNAVYSANSFSTTSAGRPILQMGLTPAVAKRPTSHVDYSLSLPFEHVVDGITKVAFTARSKGQFTLPEEMSDTDRDNFLAMNVDLIAEAIMSAYVKDLEPAY